MFVLYRKFHGAEKVECLREVEKGKVEIVVTTFETYRDHEVHILKVDFCSEYEKNTYSSVLHSHKVLMKLCPCRIYRQLNFHPTAL